MQLQVTFDREDDGRWIASIGDLPGVHVYGDSRDDALAKVQGLALSVLADEIQNGERDARTALTLQFVTEEAA